MSAAAFLVAATLGSAAVLKLRGPLAFRSLLREFLPDPLPKPVGVVVPLVELLLGATLASGLAPQVAGAAGIGLLLLFTAALARMAQVGTTLDCGCFGEASEASTPTSGIVRNILLIGCCALLVAVPAQASFWRESVRGIVGSATLAVGCACLWLCCSALVIRRDVLLNPLRQ